MRFVFHKSKNKSNSLSNLTNSLQAASGRAELDRRDEQPSVGRDLHVDAALPLGRPRPRHGNGPRIRQQDHHQEEVLGQELLQGLRPVQSDGKSSPCLHDNFLPTDKSGHRKCKVKIKVSLCSTLLLTAVRHLHRRDVPLPADDARVAVGQEPRRAAPLRQRPQGTIHK